MTASDDQTARLWDAITGEQLHLLSLEEAVQSASFSPDGKRVVTRSKGNITVWEAAGGKQVIRIFAEDRAFSYFQEAAFTPTAAASSPAAVNGWCEAWDAQTWRMLSQIPQGGAAWLSPDRSRVLVAGTGWASDVPAQVWDVVNMKPVTPPLPQARGTVRAAFSSDGDRLVATGADGAVRVWEIGTGEVVAGPLRHASAVTSAAFSPDGRLLVTRDSAGLVHVWDLAASMTTPSPLMAAHLGAAAVGGALV